MNEVIGIIVLALAAWAGINHYRIKKAQQERDRAAIEGEAKGMMIERERLREHKQEILNEVERFRRVKAAYEAKYGSVSGNSVSGDGDDSMGGAD